MDDIIPPMDTMPVKIFGDVSQGAILDPSMLSGYLGAGSVEGLLNAVSPSVTGVLPASLRGMLGMILGTYGDLGTSASGGIPTKRPAGVQPRHYVDAEVVSLLYAILRVALNGETLADVGLNLDDLGLPLDLSDPDMAIAAIMELHKPYGNPVTVNGAPTLTAGEKIRGYDIRPVDYGNATVNAPTILDCPIPVDHQGKTLLNKVIAAATGGVFYDLDGMVKELLGESVYSADTFALIANLLNGAIGPDGSLSGILGTVSGIVPELGAILNPFATAFTPAQYEVIAPLYLTWSSAHVDGESFAKDAKLPFNYSFKPNMVAGVQVKVDDPDTLWDDTLVCTNQAVAGTQKLSGNADNPATLLVDESLVVKKAHNAANTGWRFDYIDPATTDEAEQLRLQQYPNYFYADIVGVTLGDITTTVQDAEGNETEVTTYGPIFTETGFYNALYKLVGPLVPLLRTFLLDEDFSLLASGAGATKNAVLTIPGYNGYETGFVPLMEGLGFTNEGLNETGVIASYSALKALTNSKADQETFVKLLFKPIVTALGQLSTDPISFLLGKLPQIVYFLLAGTALEDSVRNLLKSPLVLLDTIRPLVAIDLKPYFEYLSVEGLFNQFGAVLQDTLALPGVPLDLYGLIYDDANFSFLKSLIIGTPTLYTSVAGTATPTANTYSATGANDQRAADRKGKINGGTEIGDTQYPLITCPPDQYFNNIILKLIAFVNDQTDVGTGANSLLDSLITDPAIRDLALSVLANLGTEEGAEALFDVLWQLLYGAHNVANDAQVYKGYADYKAPAYPGIGTAFQYKDGWTQEKAEKFVSGVGIDASHENELDLILDAILKLVGLPDTQTLISGFLTNGELVGTYPLGEAPVFSSAFFNKITGLISSITDDESIASILTVAAQYLSSDSLNLTQFFTPYDEDGTGWKHKSDLEAKIAAIDTAAAADKAEAFKLALVEFLKPLQGVLDLLLVGGDLNLVGLYADEDDSDRKAGCEYLLKIAGYKGYEFGLAPILAALGVKVPNYADVKKDPIGEIIQAIIDSVLTDLAKDPIKYVLDNLPNLLAFIHAHYTVGTGETAYTETALKAAVKQLITPVYALATALDPLLAGVVIPGFNDGQPINVQKLVDDILVTLDVDKLVNDFLLGGVDLGGTALTLPTTDEIYQALIIGTVGAQTTKAAIDAPHSTFLDVPTISTEPLEKHAPAQRVNADREAVFTNLVQFALTYATSGRNYDAIASLLGGTLPPIVETVLKNVQAKPQSLLAILYAVRFGADIENPDDVYSDLSGINAGPFVYEAPWTAEKAEQFIQGYKVSTNTLRGNKELDLIANWVVRTLGVTDFDGQPVESVKGLVDSALGTYAYNEQLFLQITSALQSIADNEGLAKILEIVDEVLDVDLADFLDTTDIDLSNLAADKTPAVRKAAFIQALKDLLAPINSLLNVIFAGESLDILKIEPDEAGHIDHNDYLIHLSGAYAYNYAIIPLLEALGAPNIKTFEEYQALAKSTDPVSPLVEMILDLVDEISAAPINWALANLPNIIAFISDPNALINVINALIAPLKPIVDAVLPLLVDDANPVTLPLVGTITSATTVDALLAELVGNLDVKAILNDLLGNVDLGTGALALGTADDLFQALLIGTKVKEDGKASADIAASLAWLVNHDPASDPITVDRAERTNIVADKAGLFSSLVTYLIGKVATNKSALLSLLGAAQGDLVDTILTNVGVNPQVILNILHKLRFGSAVEQNTDIYKDFDKYIAATETDPASGHIKLGAVEYVSPFTAEKADALVQGLLAGEHNANGASPLADKSELDLIVSWLIGFLNRQGILPFSDLKTLVEGLLGDQLFNAQLFESIVSVLQGVVANESVAGILSIADEHLTLDLTSFLKAEVDLTALNNATTYAQRKAAFKAALTELIRPIAPLLNVFLAGQDLAEIDIDPSSEFNPLITLSAAYGYNNGLIPIFEALGLGHIDGYVLPDYAAYQASAAGGDPVGPLVEVLLQLVEQIYTNPVDWLLSNLPTILAFVGDSHALANSLDALLAPVYGLVEVLEPLIAGIDVGGLIGLDNLVLTDLVASILPTMNAKDLVSLFLPDGIAIAGLTFTDAELTALVSELFDSLILGSIKEETSGAVKIVDGVPTSEHVKRKYIDADKGDLLTSLFTFIVSKVEDLDVLSLLNVELSDPIGTIVNNVYDNPQAVLNLLYHLKFGLGAPSGSLAEVYQGFVDLRTSGKVHPFVYQHPYWDAGMSGTLYGSNHLVAPNSYNDNDLAVVVDSILNYVTGQTAGQYVKAIIGPTIYGTDLFNKVIELIGGIAGDPNLASILDIADEVLDNIDLQDVLDLSEVPALDGTRETFELALEKALNPLKPLLDVFLAGKPFKVIKLDGTDDKDTLITISAFAGYEYGIKPLLETLGASAPSYAAIQSASNPLKPIIKAVLDLLESIYKNPVDWALTNLPNIIAFIESGTLKYAVEQIAQPIYTLAEVIAPLAKGVEINGEELDIIALANSVLSSIDLKKLASDFLAPGISIGDINIVTAWLNAGGEEETLLQGLIDALLVGTLVENADGSFKVIADKPGLVTSIVDYLIGTAVVKNQAALEGLLGGSITEPIKGILDNLTANPQLILRVISNILYGNGFTQSYIVYKTENLGMSGAGDVTYREEWWTRNHAKYVWDRAPDFVNKLWELLFGKPLGNLDLGGLGTTAGSFLEDIIGSALFTQENLNALVALVNDNVPDLNTIEIGGKSLVTLLKEGVVINGQSLDLDAMFAKFRGYTPAAYPVTTRESFIAHLVTLAAPLVPVLDILLAGSNIEIIKRTEPGPSDEKYVVNIYGAEGYKYVLIPLLEAFTAPLGKNEWVYTPDQFKDFNGEQKLNAIFEPLLKTLELVLADPINNGIKIIPNLIYTLEGQANALIQKLLDPAYNLVGSFGDVYAFDLASLIPTIDIPNILDGILQGTGLGLSYDALKTLLVGKLLTYTSRNGDTAAKYVSLVDPAQPDYDYMPDILTAVLRFVVITFVANKANQKVVIDWLISNGLSGAKLKIIQTTVDDIFVFIREGHISDIHGRFVLGADIFLNFAFILFYGLDKVVCKIYDTWKSVNAEISKSYQNLLNSHKYDQSFAKNAEAFTNRYFKPIVDVNSDNGTVTVAPNGFIAFWLNIIAWFKKIFSFLF
ncbi:MAG: hypothetical protein LBN05_01105 [Oscillospiraceae bacterium]|nr:hypothetical protein [Oscillospiraceae bacterium]